MGRRPIIIPRHPSLLATKQQQNYKSAREPILKADSLAHPLALMENPNINNSFGSSCSGSSSSSSSGNGGNIGIRRHGQYQQQLSTPESKKRTRMVRKRSPTSVLLPLDFIEEEEEEEEEPQQQQQQQQQQQPPKPKPISTKGFDQPESVISERAVLSGLLDDDDDEEGFSELFFDDSSLFGSAIEHVNESNDFGHNLVLPIDESEPGFGNRMAQQPLHDGSLSSSSSSEDRSSTGTFREMMVQQEHEMRYQQERETMALHQQQRENHMSTMLTTSVGSSILSTSTLERSLEVKKKHFYKCGHPENSRSNSSGSRSNLTNKRSSFARQKESTFQRLLKSATQCHQKASEPRNQCESMNKISSCANSNSNSIKKKNTTHPRNLDQEQYDLTSPLLLPPEEQRMAALARYRYNQSIHTNSTNFWHTKREMGSPDQLTKRNSQPDHRMNAQRPIVHDHSLEQKGEKEKYDPRVSVDSFSPEDSFATIDEELKSLRNYTLQSNASFRLANSYLSNDLQESENLVKVLEEQLLAAKEQRELCLERYELAKEKRQKEKELTAIRTLHLEILACSGKNDRSRSMLLERHEHEIASSSSSSCGGGRRDAGILGTMFSSKQQHGEYFPQQHRSEDTKGQPGESREAGSLAHDKSATLSSQCEGNPADESCNKAPKSEAELTPNSTGDTTGNSCFGIFEDPYVHKSVEELRVIKNRLEAIKDLFDKARYMVSEDFSSSASDRLRKQHQSQVMIETAASKYILFRSKNLV